jgi:diguanylate cyclase (GGDEF)-like protein
MFNSSLAGRRAVVLIVTAAVALAAAVFGMASLERSVARTADTRLEISQRLLTAMLDQETAVRGYINNHDVRFLEPWYSGRQNFAAAMAELRGPVSSDGALAQQLDRQAQLAGHWQAQAGASIAATQGDRPISLLSALAAKATMDAFRAANAAFARALDQRRDGSLATANIATGAVALVIALIFGIGIFGLVRRRTRLERLRSAGAGELRELLQVSASEEESRQLLIRHVKRILPRSGAEVFNRNNSDDRLEPTFTPEVHRTPLRDLDAEQLQPRSCLAVRLSRPYDRHHGIEPLLPCEVCGKLPADTACEPLLVGGHVIGSVLVASDSAISSTQRELVRDAVLQAAPILANQRNLTLAETRAASDALTGLPNRRAADETLKRMLAHAARAVSPLSVVLLDLDHFKQVNDRHGHETGDRALALVGEVIRSTIRTADFAARYGGEEFILILPDTDAAGAVLVAEKLRVAIHVAELPGVEQLAGSLGIASFPADAVEPEQLLRKADRALYGAKAAGRNRVHVAADSRTG